MTPSRYLPPPWWRKLLTRIKIAVGYLPWVRRGYWFWDMRTDTLFWNRQELRQFGLKGASEVGTYESLFNVRLWDDRDREHVRKTVEIARQTHRQFAHQFLARTPDGEQIIIDARGWWLFGENGEPWAMYGWNSRMNIHPEHEPVVVATIKLRQVKDAKDPGLLRAIRHCMENLHVTR